MEFYGDKICVLCLTKNFNEDLKSHFNIFSNPVEYEVIEGVKNPINEGDMDVNLWTILKHSTSDPVSCDILKNHLNIIRKYYDAGIQSLFIMEEDARFPRRDPKSMETWTNSNLWMKNNLPKWDLFYFGYCCWPILASFWCTPHVIRLPTPLCAHAYVINRSGMEKVLNFVQNPTFDPNIHIDKLFVKIPGIRRYGCFPMLSFQEESPALYVKACDILNKNVTFKSFCQFNERLCLGVPFIIIAIILISLYYYLK
ncbi:MAG: hypothetical protein CMM15_07480 [Rhodospirillaceae bacterium]|nr:hypothetical protein [Rhodospirillaceae bacterium]|tara:strand:- start:7561 stop:8325 length:765 start_codon:yes stop_codon:yes gene_type:complete